MDLGSNLQLEFLAEMFDFSNMTLRGACKTGALFSMPVVCGVANARSTHTFPGRFVTCL